MVLCLKLGELLAVFSVVAAQSSSMSLPVIDLGYAVHQATYNFTGQTYTFANIRYAEPPTGDLRFAAPLPRTTVNRTLNDGSQGGTCPNAYPAWLLKSQGLNASSIPADPTTSEDCLFLDVVVPAQVLQANSLGSSKKTGAPVIIWSYGGGFVLGNKNSNPAGLILASEQGGSEAVVYVAMNYRLGLFGWLSGPSFQENGTANAALHDQRLAFEWVQQNIHLFGGDPSRVTVLGESSGAAMIEHQITAYGGLKGSAPFQQGIMQSPGWVPNTSPMQQEALYQSMLTAGNVKTLQEARSLSTQQLQAINAQLVGNSTYGFFTFGPTVDGSFVPALPGQLLLRGAYDKNLRLMLAHNSHEGILYTAPIQNQTTFEAVIYQVFPDISTNAFNYVVNVLYPAVYNGSYPYTSSFERTVLFWSEIRYVCNVDYLSRAFRNATYNYQFSVPPGSHGDDVPYTFYNGPNARVLNSTIALVMQSYITTFAQSSKPSAVGSGSWPMYGADGRSQDLNLTRIQTIADPSHNTRCLWWQKGLYY